MDQDGLHELFAPVFPVTVKRMFGGYGIYGPAGIFAIAVDGGLFFKVDDSTRARWEAAGSAPFSYEKKTGQQAVMSYYALPEDAYDDPEALREWVALADIAARAPDLRSGSRPASRSKNRPEKQR